MHKSTTGVGDGGRRHTIGGPGGPLSLSPVSPAWLLSLALAPVEVSSAVGMELQDLNPCPGIRVQKVIKSRFGCSVFPSFWGRAFFLVVSFGRCKFKLSPSSVEAILQATVGGVASDFSVLQLSDRVFRVSVSSGLVVFMLLSCDLLSVLLTRCSSTSGAMAVLIGFVN